MAILSIDTSAAVSASLVSPQGEELASDTVAQERRHAEELMPLIVRLLDTARLTPEDLTAVVAGRGPAPFTGLRVGLVTAHTFAFARDVPLYGVCSLDAIAADTAQTLGLTAGQRIAALSDARRKEVYWATYTVTPQGTITPWTHRVSPTPLTLQPPASSTSLLWSVQVPTFTASSWGLTQSPMRPPVPAPRPWHDWRLLASTRTNLPRPSTCAALMHKCQRNVSVRPPHDTHPHQRHCHRTWRGAVTPHGQPGPRSDHRT